MNRRGALSAYTSPLPGSVPYENRRPIRVRQRFDGWALADFLEGACRFASVDEWKRVVKRGLLREGDRAVGFDHRVRAGQVLTHVCPETVEPDVNSDIAVIHEDESLLVVDKPAPLPVHPCGRFNKNTLLSILEGACADLQLRVVHRLDSDTSGCLVFAKTRRAANELRKQFQISLPTKRYFALVSPVPVESEFCCAARISADPGPRGFRALDPAGLVSRTEFRVRRRHSDGSSLVEARPLTGRTNQIRVHLAHLGYPVMGDCLYGGDCVFGERLCLHAKELTIRHPDSGREVTFSAALPEWVGSRECVSL